LQLQPDWPGLWGEYAWLLATCEDEQVRDGAEAVRIAERALRMSGSSDPRLLDVLAAAYAERGDFSEAQRTAEQALGRARAMKDDHLAARIASRSGKYRAGQPHREPPGSPPLGLAGR